MNLIFPHPKTFYSEESCSLITVPFLKRIIKYSGVSSVNLLLIRSSIRRNIKSGKIKFLSSHQNRILTTARFIENYHLNENLLFNNNSVIKGNSFICNGKKFNYHHFGWLQFIPLNERIKHCRQWVMDYGSDTEFLSDPRGISVRVVNWIKSGVNDPVISWSIYQQARLLYSMSEDNQFVSARGKALIFCGIFFNEERWKEKGKEMLLNEFSIRSLKDGGFRGDIGECASVVHDLLDIINVDYSFGEVIKVYALRLLSYLFWFSYNDGKRFLFSRSEEFSFNELKEYASKLGIDLAVNNKNLFRFPRSGYYGIKNETVNMAVRAGSGKDPGLFSFELCIKGEKMLGTGSNIAQPGYSAYNNIIVDREQMLLKGTPGEVVFEEGKRLFFNCTSVRIGRTGGDEIKTFYFSGIIRSADEMMHKREIYYDDAVSLITVKDTVRGYGKHTVRSFVNIPRDAYTRINDRRILIKCGSSLIVISSENSFVVDKNTLIFEAPVPSVIEYRIKF